VQACKVLVGKREKESSNLEGPDTNRKNNIKMDFTEIWWDGQTDLSGQE